MNDRTEVRRQRHRLKFLIKTGRITAIDSVKLKHKRYPRRKPNEERIKYVVVGALGEGSNGSFKKRGKRKSRDGGNPLPNKNKQTDQS